MSDVVHCLPVGGGWGAMRTVAGAGLSAALLQSLLLLLLPLLEEACLVGGETARVAGILGILLVQRCLQPVDHTPLHSLLVLRLPPRAVLLEHPQRVVAAGLQVPQELPHILRTLLHHVCQQGGRV